MLQSRQWIAICFSVLLLFVSSSLRFSYDLVGVGALFTLVSIVGPSLGAFYRPAHMMGIVTLYYALCWLVKSPASLAMGFTFGIPTWLAAMTLRYAEKNSWKDAALRLGVPLLAMALFILHPVGKEAAPYTLFWWIPVASFALDKFVSKSSLRLVLGALAATFVAHACGSVTTLYLRPLTPEVWLSLIPVVVIERLSFAGGIALAVTMVRSFAPKPSLAWVKN